MRMKPSLPKKRVQRKVFIACMGGCGKQVAAAQSVFCRKCNKKRLRNKLKLDLKETMKGVQ